MTGFYLFIISTILPIIVVGTFWIKDSKRYLKLYRKKVNPPYPLSMEEVNQKYYNDPLQFILNIPLILKTRWTIFWVSHEDHELNTLAIKIRNYFYFMVLIILANFILRVLFSKL